MFFTQKTFGSLAARRVPPSGALRTNEVCLSKKYAALTNKKFWESV